MTYLWRYKIRKGVLGRRIKSLVYHIMVIITLCPLHNYTTKTNRLLLKTMERGGQLAEEEQRNYV